VNWRPCRKSLPRNAHRLWQSGEAVILDVRGLSEYREGHIPNAKHIHAGRVLQQAHEIPTDRP
jgi:hydroxyacylglutathione hydrolase